MNNRIYPKDIFVREMKKIERRKDLVVRKLLIEKKIYTDYELKRIKLIEQHRIKINELNNINK